jgi:penicillin-binding protein A
MNKSLAWTWGATLLLILALLANVTYLQGFEARNLRDDPLNARRYDDRFLIDRGPILAGGERLAWSERSGESDGGRARYLRRYLEGPVFAPVTGYFSRFSDSGLERAEIDFLDGTDPRLAVTSFVDRIIGKPVRGGTVEATVDPQAQRIAYADLSESTSLRAAAVALDIRTGAIRVMASYPSYDPNTLATLDVAAVEARFRQLQQDTFRQPLLNKAAGETFPPGSTFKTIVAASALAAGQTSESQVRAGNSYTPPQTDRSIANSHDSGSCGQARTTLLNAFAESCNTTFASLGAETLGNAELSRQAASFGYDQRIEIARGMRSAASAFPGTGPAGTALASIGQGDNRSTVLHMALTAAAVANEGEIMQPYLVQRLRSAEQNVVEETRPRRLTRAMSAEAAAQLRDMMTAVVREGTATNLRDADIAGKTGTADVDGRSYNERWFAGFGPVGNPRYAVAVLTEGTGFGGTAAGPIAARILRALADR